MRQHCVLFSDLLFTEIRNRFRIFLYALVYGHGFISFILILSCVISDTQKMLELVSSWYSLVGFDIFGVIKLTIVAGFLWMFYALRLERNKLLIDKIPGYKDWPIVGDIFHLKRDPVGECTCVTILCWQSLLWTDFKSLFFKLSNMMVDLTTFVCFLEFYPQVVEFLDGSREKKIHKFRTGTWAIVALSTPEDVEKLLRSNVLIDKSDDYVFLHKWLGLGLLTRLVERSEIYVMYILVLLSTPYC